MTRENGPYDNRTDLFRAMIEEPDDEKRAELRERYVNWLHQDARESVALFLAERKAARPRRRRWGR